MGYSEGFVLNDETGAANLAKRNMPQGGEAVTSPKPPKEEDDEPKRILAGSSDFDVVMFVDIPLIDNMGNVQCITPLLTKMGLWRFILLCTVSK